MTQLQDDIFQALIKSHETQRTQAMALEGALKAGKIDEAKALYPEFALELQAHAAAEERHLYIPVMQHDAGLDLSRHAITEHHKMDELMATLSDGRTGDANWQKALLELIEVTRHHLKEEESAFFKEARGILDTDLQARLGSLYQVEHTQFEQTHEGEQ